MQYTNSYIILSYNQNIRLVFFVSVSVIALQLGTQCIQNKCTVDVYMLFIICLQHYSGSCMRVCVVIATQICYQILCYMYTYTGIGSYVLGMTLREQAKCSTA